MNNVVEFKLRNFEVLFMLPIDKIVKLRKTRNDSITIQMSGNTGTARVKATTVNSAKQCLTKVLPDSKIISAVCLRD